MQRSQQFVQLSKDEAIEDDDLQYVITSAEGDVILGDPQSIAAPQLSISGTLVQQGATVQEVQIVNGGGTEVTYAYTESGELVTLAHSGSGSDAEMNFVTTEDDGSGQGVNLVPLSISDQHQPSFPRPYAANVDESFKYYDKLRGKINSEFLSDLVTKYDAENATLSKNDRMNRWNLVAEQYCSNTGQHKSRSMLMKKWTSAKYYREHGEGNKTRAARSVTPERIVFREHGKRGVIQAKQLRQYDIVKLEAARLERDAQRVLFENATIEGEKLRKETAILDVQLDTMKLELAMKREEAIKNGVAIQLDHVDVDDNILYTMEEMSPRDLEKKKDLCEDGEES